MNVIWHKTGLLHDPVTWYKITQAGEQVAQLDFQNKATEVQVVRVALLWKWTSKVRITGWGSFKLLETIRCVLRNIERFQMNLGSLVKDLVRSSNILLFLQVELTDTTIIFRRQRKQTAVTNITTHGLRKNNCLTICNVCNRCLCFFLWKLKLWPRNKNAMLRYFYSPPDCLFADSSASIPEPYSSGSNGGPVRNSIRNQEHDWMKSFTCFQNWKLEADLQFDRGILVINKCFSKWSAL